MAIGDPYATLAQLKARLAIGDAADDVVLTQALDSASRGVELWCKRQFNQTTTATARTYEPLRADLVLVDDIHTTTDLDIAVDTAGDGTYGTTLAATDYELEPRNGTVDGVPGWPYWRIRTADALPMTGRATVRVTARWGWPKVPPTVVEATLILAAETAKLKDAPFGVAGFGEFGAVRVRDNPKVAQMLSPYQLYTVAVA